MKGILSRIRHAPSSFQENTVRLSKNSDALQENRWAKTTKYDVYSLECIRFLLGFPRLCWIIRPPKK